MKIKCSASTWPSQYKNLNENDNENNENINENDSKNNIKKKYNLLNNKL